VCPGSIKILSLSHAARSGLPPSITDPYDSVSDSEEEDEADEDSNGSLLAYFSYYVSNPLSPAEEYYKNDYPEEDDPSDDSGSSGEYGVIYPSLFNAFSRRIS
jgi:hypothetical protein